MEPCVIVDALSQPDAYPERPAQVAVRQTHISWLFFTDYFVYKVKKPVNFGFLDFTTLEARRRCCEAEVRLNQRLAPGVYLGVVAVKTCDGVIHLGGVGETVEYAVQMRRLPEERMLPARLAAGEVTPETMERLARLLAEFHARADRGPEIDRAGSLGTILANWEENFAQTRPYLDFPLSRETWERIRAWVQAFCRTRERLFTQRVAEGRIRDGHGDLRAEHICLTDPIAIFDCVEFNQRFRHGDVAADVAFLAMDLEAHGFPLLSQAFVQAYVERSGDRGLLQVLDFYTCYRAVVRAKVECFRLDDSALSPGEKRAALRAAQRYWQLAARYANRLRRPWLLLMCGLMGTGKSVLAETLAKRVDLELLSSDVTRKRLAGIPPTARASASYAEGLYTPERTEATYACLFQQAEHVLAQGRSVLIDASFQRAAYRTQARDMARHIGAEFCVLECWCPKDEMRRRLDARGRHGEAMSDGRWELVAQQQRGFDPLVEVPPHQHLRVDTTRPPDDIVEEIVAKLGLARPYGQRESPVTRASGSLPPMEEPAMEAIGRMLLAIDFSVQAERVMALGLALAKACGARLSVLHVVHDLQSFPGVFVAQEPLEALQTRLEAEAREKLEAFVHERLHGYANYELRLATGSPAGQILHTAHITHADLLLLGAHMEGKPEHRLLGDTVARVLREAVCPVIIVPQTRTCRGDRRNVC